MYSDRVSKYDLGNTTITNCRQTYDTARKEPHNNHETPGRQTKQSNQPSLPDQGYCKTRIDIK